MELQVVYFSIERWGTIGVVYTERGAKAFVEDSYSLKRNIKLS